MSYRFHPLWWPVLGALSPALAPFLLLRRRGYVANRERAALENAERISRASTLDLPELEFLEVTVLVEWAAEEDFLGDAGVSYLFRSDRGSLLFDVGFGPQTRSLAHNADRLGVSLDDVDALAISHLHLDHMGGMNAQKEGRVGLPEELGDPGGKPCFLPEQADADGFKTSVVDGPQPLAAGIHSTGPLARSLFFMGWTEEQALIARVKDKGLVVFTGCGHPSIELILELAAQLSETPLHALGGGLHFPITQARGNKLGIQLQRLAGTGLPPWRSLNDGHLTAAISAINDASPQRVLLSAHDSCDHATGRFTDELTADVEILRAGATYKL